jgi:hypothetical protein
MNARRHLSLLAAIALSLSAGCAGCGGSGDGGDPPPPPPPPAATCTDGIKNGVETGIDCGGSTCLAQGKSCPDGQGCAAAVDCASAYCNPANGCSTPSCSDLWQNGTETGLNCGGATCVAEGKTCADGGACTAAADCTSGYCNPTNVCSTPSCSDLWQNGTETGLNCGGATCVAEGKTCADGYACSVAADCTTGFCNGSGICGTATCVDGAMNGLETGVDCGGATCVAQGKSCPDDSGCTVAADCTSGYCNASNVCKSPTCTDFVRNGAETGIDCGGAACVALGKTCPLDSACTGAADCTSGYCAGNLCKPPPCSNLVKDGYETDVDCGGVECTFESKTCLDGQGCAVAADCASGYCTPALTCATPTCLDSWKNGLETDVNCGGPTCGDCADGKGCAVNGDCLSGFCNPSTLVCAAPTCADGWKNGAETDVDCGGAACVALGKTCAEGFACSAATDCVAPLACDATTKVCATQCLANPTACTANEQCCTGFCNMSDPLNKVCADPVLCTANGQGCAFNSACCTGYCSPSKLCGTAPVCRDLGVACSANADCCDQYCNPSSRLCETPASVCGATGTTCTDGSGCCSTACNTTTHTCTSTAFCKVAGAACLSSGECCSVDCQGGVCSDTVCKTTGTACSAGSECCTGTCTSNVCAIVPAPSGTSACATLGDTCDPASDTCCSKNCQGGKCTPAFTCHAPSDLCYRNEDCCSGKCTTTSPTVPGRCLAPTGGDVQGGAPCDGPTTCVTRICADLGSGQTVCKPAGGCKMTGDYCNPNEYSTTTACTTANYRTVCGPLYGDNATCKAGFCTNPNGVCCGGTPDKVDPGGYGVECAPKQVGAPTSCTNGQSCNPPGNICGAAGDNASQNCCNGQKEVCKRDLNGIARCFGGGSIACPTGYDGANPACCIGTDPGSSGVDNVCQFRDQCCNFVPCVPDANGILRCTPPTCTALHGACDGGDDGSCCAGTVCTADTGDLYPSDYTCEVPLSCTSNGNTCTFNSECCSNNCAGTVCAPPCAGAGATCTPGDCCAGLDCAILPGDTSGTCESVSSCAPTNGSCNVDADCCNSPDEICNEGTCQVPPSCTAQFGACTPASTCCSPTSCIEQNGAVCSVGSTSCSCDQCSGTGGGCDPSAVDTGCCVGLQCFGSGTVGTCASCLLAGSSCSSTSECCPAAPGGAPVVCADTTTGEPCAGGSCSCETCVLAATPCSANGTACCGVGYCARADDPYTSCGNGDVDCTCVFTGG